VIVPRFAPGRAAAGLTLRLADLVALVYAAVIAGLGGWRAAFWLTFAYGALAASGLHRPRICLRVFDQTGRIAAAITVGVACVLPWTPAGVAGRLALAAAGLVPACRAIALAGLRAAHRRGWLVGAALLVGANETALQLTGLLQKHPELGLHPAGFLACGPDATGPLLPPPGAGGLPLLGQLGDLDAVITRHGISRVILCPGAGQGDGLVPVLRACRTFGVDLCAVPKLRELSVAMPRGCCDEVLGIPLLPLPGRRRLAVRLALKRVLDLAAAAVLLVLISPLLVALAAVTLLQLRRPALFRQVRVVGSGRLAEIMKLRTLAGHNDPDICWAPSRQQCTRFGWILRASHLDELPQLVNVLRGEMSMVGPRPERPYFARQFAQEIPGYSDRQRMRAGMTGWAQVHGLNGDTSVRDRVRFDNSYIECWSLWLDLVILARTVPAALAGAFRPGLGASADPAFGAVDRPAALTARRPEVHS
jgi:lipopolysaccharide/colanic/teichoic acid biosynthesis glycosyltransferase